MRKLRSVLLFLLVVGLLAVGAKAKAQVYVGIGVQPVCSYGYCDYAPYACAPYGFYDSGYFYKGIFLGVEPWANYGYGHGWGHHRFSGGRGGGYYGRGSRGGQVRGGGHGQSRGGRGGGRGRR